MEAAGVALAIVPLLLKGVKGFKLLRPLISYKCYCEEVEDFLCKLNVQQKLFHHHCKWLLGRVEAEYILNDTEHNDYAQNKDESLDEEYQYVNNRLAEHFGPQQDAFAELLHSIAKSLGEIESTVNDLKAKYQERRAKTGNEKRRWAQQFREQLRLTFSRRRILNCIQNLRDNNQDFLYLRQAATDTNDRPWTANGSARSSIYLQQFELVREASSHLYHDISCISKCVKHSDHTASIGLEDDVTSHLLRSRDKSFQQRIRFDMGLVCENVVRQDDRRQLLLHIESNISTCTKPKAISSEVFAANAKDRKMAVITPWLPENQTLCNSEEDRSKRLPGTKRHKRVAFDDRRSLGERQLSHKITNTPILSSPCQTTDDTMPNLCGRVDFCAYLENRCRIGPTDISVCVGYLQSATADIKHLVYRPPVQQDRNSPITLFSVLSEMTKTLPYAGLKSSHRILIARSLALFVLQFCTTPWLPETWSTTDVVLLQQPGSAKFTSSQPPDIPRLKVHFPSNKPTKSSSTENLRNPIIHRFGVALMELGFQRNMRDLQTPEETKAGPSFAEKLAIKRLDRDLDTPLGIRYADVARKCTSSARESWVNKYDIDSVELQTAFYTEVVQELADLEVAFRRLDMNR